MKTISYGYGPNNKDGNDYTPVEWIVLEEGNGTLLISRDILFAAVYDPAEGTRWEDSALRKYLNGAFLRRFTLDGLLPVGIGPCGRDRVTILSMRETEQYLPAETLRACAAAPYAQSGAEDRCWLRTEVTRRGMQYLCTDGVMLRDDYGFPAEKAGVRPVIRVK